MQLISIHIFKMDFLTYLTSNDLIPPSYLFLWSPFKQNFVESIHIRVRHVGYVTFEPCQDLNGLWDCRKTDSLISCPFRSRGDLREKKTVLFVIEIYYRRSSDIHISRVAHPKNKLIPFQGDVSWRQQIWTAVGISVVDEYSVQWCLSLVGHARRLLFDLQTHIRVPICIFEALKVILRSK